MRQTLLAFCALISCVFDPALEPVCAKDEATQKQLTTKHTVLIRMACSWREIVHRRNSMLGSPQCQKHEPRIPDSITRHSNRGCSIFPSVGITRQTTGGVRTQREGICTPVAHDLEANRFAVRFRASNSA